jgi:hypothetical protein
MTGTTDAVCIGSDPEVGRIVNCVCGQDLPFGNRPSSAENRTVSFAPAVAVCGGLAVARKRTFMNGKACSNLIGSDFQRSSGLICKGWMTVDPAQGQITGELWFTVDPNRGARHSQDPTQGSG